MVTVGERYSAHATAPNCASPPPHCARQWIDAAECGFEQQRRQFLSGCGQLFCARLHACVICRTSSNNTVFFPIVVGPEQFSKYLQDMYACAHARIRTHLHTWAQHASTSTQAQARKHTCMHKSTRTKARALTYARERTRTQARGGRTYQSISVIINNMRCLMCRN